MLLLIPVLLYCLICLVLGIVQYVNTPKPPFGLTFREYLLYYRIKDWERENKIMEHLEAGNKIKAIRNLRYLTGCSMSDAVFTVNQLEISLKRRKNCRTSFNEDDSL